MKGFCAPFERRVGELTLGKFLGRHVPRWTNSTKDNFSLYKFQKEKEKKDKFPKAAELSGESCPGGTCLLATRNDEKTV